VRFNRLFGSFAQPRNHSPIHRSTYGTYNNKRGAHEQIIVVKQQIEQEKEEEKEGEGCCFSH